MNVFDYLTMNTMIQCHWLLDSEEDDFETLAFTISEHCGHLGCMDSLEKSLLACPMKIPHAIRLQSAQWLPRGSYLKMLTNDRRRRTTEAFLYCKLAQAEHSIRVNMHVDGGLFKCSSFNKTGLLFIIIFLTFIVFHLFVQREALKPVRNEIMQL